MDATAKATEAELIERASSGDRAALADLVNYCVNRQFVDVTAFEAMTMAEGFARLAAAHGETDDRLMLAGVLRVRAYHVWEFVGDATRASALLFQSEAICDELHSLRLSNGAEFLAGILTAEADYGDDLAAIRLVKLTNALSPADADALRHNLNKACRECREAEEAGAVAR